MSFSPLLVPSMVSIVWLPVRVKESKVGKLTRQDEQQKKVDSSK
jgi:hypothetical protein